jgi:beta-mannosidase
MEGHQRNSGGNARILETMCRYFRFPKGFEEMVFLSQVQQGLAIKTAIEYWRSTKPRCMGTLFWQINDTWPVHSWASLDYGGQWKPLHYMAKRFFEQVNLVAVPVFDAQQTNSRGDPIEGATPDAIVLKGINDTPSAAPIRFEVLAVNMSGGTRILHQGETELSPDQAEEVFRVAAGDIADGEFLYFLWSDGTGAPIGENDFFPRAYKYFDLPASEVTAHWSEIDGKPAVTLKTDQPALFVTLSSDLPGYFSDNSITLLPGRDRTLTFTPRKGAAPDAAALASGTVVHHLAQTY